MLPCPRPMPKRVHKKLFRIHTAQVDELFRAHFKYALIRRCYRECRPNRCRISLLGSWLKPVIKLADSFWTHFKWLFAKQTYAEYSKRLSYCLSYSVNALNRGVKFDVRLCTIILDGFKDRVRIAYQSEKGKFTDVSSARTFWLFANMCPLLKHLRKKRFGWFLLNGASTGLAS